MRLARLGERISRVESVGEGRRGRDFEKRRFACRGGGKDVEWTECARRGGPTWLEREWLGEGWRGGRGGEGQF